MRNLAQMNHPMSRTSSIALVLLCPIFFPNGASAQTNKEYMEHARADVENLRSIIELTEEQQEHLTEMFFKLEPAVVKQRAQIAEIQRQIDQLLVVEGLAQMGDVLPPEQLKVVERAMQQGGVFVGLPVQMDPDQRRRQPRVDAEDGDDAGDAGRDTDR